MTRLIDGLAAQRRLYRRPVPTAPDVLLIDIPPAMRSTSLPLGRFYPVLIESDIEAMELRDFLHAEVEVARAPDLLDHRPSALHGVHVSLCLYEPGEPDWPWLLVCHWPDSFTAKVPANSDLFARGAYTIEMFEGRADLDQAIARIVTVVRASSTAKILLVSGEDIIREPVVLDS